MQLLGLPIRPRLGVPILWCWCSVAAAQGVPEGTTQSIVITGRGNEKAAIAGFGDRPLALSPFSATTLAAPQRADSGVATLNALTRIDASLSDAYNADGYWAILSARGYTLDNRFNYRRDGLPINAETALALDNKERIELLKGTSGIQAGTSAPGGLVNLVVKRPAGRVRSLMVETREPGSVLGAADLGERFGRDGAVAARVNVAAERLDGSARPSRGNRWLAALAVDIAPGADTLVQAEVERGHQRQPSAAGFSLLGNRVPDPKAIDPRLNLNHQPWGGPVQMDGTTASLKWTQRLGSDWRLVLHTMSQRLKTDDRTAFPYGVYNADYECPQWCDRFAPDGTFTYWQYESLGERRDTTASSVSVAGRATWGAVTHDIEAGALHARCRGRFNDQIFDIAGTGRIDGSLTTPPSAGFTDANTHRDEQSTELFVRDALRHASGAQLWAGLRHTRLSRQSARTSPASDGLRATDYKQIGTAPWLAAAFEFSPQAIVYASRGEGLESEVAPNRSRYTNAGQALPALKSRQSELGAKVSGTSGAGGEGWLGWQVALAVFDIERPVFADVGACNGADSCTRLVDGVARHRGAEVSASLQAGRWTLGGSAMGLQARRGGARDAAANGLRPLNVPASSLRLNAEYRTPGVPGLALWAAVAAEGGRRAAPDDPGLRIDGWQRLDLGLRYRHEVGGTPFTWRLAVNNATDRRAWKESPYQFGHVYLYPLAPRTWRASLAVGF
jgi:iron complex outermembrane receptor protein